MDDTCAIPKVEIRRYPTQRDRFRSDGGYWKGFRTQSTQQTGAVSWLSYSPSKPHQLAATSGTRVVVYEDGRLESQKAISKFQDLAHCGSFRSDGRLLVAGTEEGTVKVQKFHLSSENALLRFSMSTIVPFCASLKATNKPCTFRISRLAKFISFQPAMTRP